MKKRILVFGLSENYGGIESFLYNYYLHIDREEIQFDFLCNTYEKVAYEEELKKMGARFFNITPRSSNIRRFKNELTELFEHYSEEWDCIWVNVNSLANIDYLKIAKKYRVRKRIIHSHNSSNLDGVLRGMLHKKNKKIIDKYATDFWACSEGAKKWFYKKSILNKAKIIPNAIDIKKLEYDEEKRNAIREKIGAKDRTYVIGNIGRLHFQKNQKFIVDIFCKYLKIDSDAKLVFVGDGEDHDMLEKKCAELGILKSVFFVGIQKDISGWLSSFDLFLFPSVFEGLSVVALEAQANGVPILASREVSPMEIQINDNYYYYPLNKSVSEWVKKIYSLKNSTKRIGEEIIVEGFSNKGFLIENEAKMVQELLIE